ncbi:hypothetical protein ABWH93_17780 [Seohaeicola saemankumensis]|jgi:hypothetical protein|uniref:hypothetical protein n=1 Tax=Seohaeicola TaxID=481178 RepID=UPI0007F54E58|nr:hypothetical protein A8B83_15670 [Rhodobacteraceae bacterium EhC02]
MLRLIAWLAILTPATMAGAQTFEIQGQDGTICAAFAFDRNVIATAAHCTGKGDSFQVLGLGSPGEARLIARGAFDGRYLTETEKTAVDVALLTTELRMPRATDIAMRDAGIGEVLEIEPPGGGYSRCRVLARYGDAYDLACQVSGGWSGSPVYTRRQAGARFLIGMVSGRLGRVGEGIAVMVHARALAGLQPPPLAGTSTAQP